MMNTVTGKTADLELQDEAAELIERYKKDHPEIVEALRVFDISNESYEQAVRAMYGDNVSWSTSVNPSLPSA